YTEGSVISDDARAFALFDKSVALYNSIAAKHPGEAPTVAKRTAYRYRGQTAIRLHKTEIGIESGNTLLAMANGLLKTNPNNAAARSDRAQAFSLLGAAYELRQEMARALTAYQAASREYAELKASAGLSSRDEKYAKDVEAAVERLGKQRVGR